MQHGSLWGFMMNKMLQVLSKNVVPIRMDEGEIRKARGCKQKPKKRKPAKKVNHAKMIYFREHMIEFYRMFSEAIYKDGMKYSDAAEMCATKSGYPRSRFLEYMRKYNSVIRSGAVRGFEIIKMPDVPNANDKTQELPHILRASEHIANGMPKGEAYIKLAGWLRCSVSTAAGKYREWSKSKWDKVNY